MSRPLQVFLCHASQDKPAVRELYQRLKAEDWIDPWLDEEKLTLGQHWATEIEEALDDADAVIIFLSRNSVKKEGFIQRELNYAWEISLEKPREYIFLIPFRLDDCEIPRHLKSRQWGDYFGDKKESTYQVLLRSLKQRHLQRLQIEADEKAEHEQVEQEKEKRESDNKAIVDTIARNFQDFIENIEREGTEEIKPVSTIEEKKEKAKPFTRILNPSSLTPPKKSEVNKNKKSFNPRRFLVVGIILAGMLGVLFIGSYIFNNLLVNKILEDTPSPTLQISNSATIIGIDGMAMVYIPAGKFIMGSNIGDYDEKPIHNIYLNSYWIDQTEVTNAMYTQCVKSKQCNSPSLTYHYIDNTYANHPVVAVSWNDAINYCAYVGRRLPTEAEWEKAARGTTNNIYPWGNTDLEDELLNYNKNAGSTTKVGSYPAGASIYGILDMAGNVSEWVNDWYGYYPPIGLDNTSGPDSGEYRVLRGGSWIEYNADNFRSTKRNFSKPTDFYYYLGFRCAMDAEQ